jgi:hypothetical protein
MGFNAAQAAHAAGGVKRPHPADNNKPLLLSAPADAGDTSLTSAPADACEFSHAPASADARSGHESALAGLRMEQEPAPAEASREHEAAPTGSRTEYEPASASAAEPHAKAPAAAEWLKDDEPALTGSCTGHEQAFAGASSREEQELAFAGSGSHAKNELAAAGHGLRRKHEMANAASGSLTEQVLADVGSGSQHETVPADKRKEHEPALADSCEPYLEPTATARLSRGARYRRRRKARRRRRKGGVRSREGAWLASSCRAAVQFRAALWHRLRFRPGDPKRLHQAAPRGRHAYRLALRSGTMKGRRTDRGREDSGAYRGAGPRVGNCTQHGTGDVYHGGVAVDSAGTDGTVKDTEDDASGDGGDNSSRDGGSSGGEEEGADEGGDDDAGDGDVAEGDVRLPTASPGQTVIFINPNGVVGKQMELDALRINVEDARDTKMLAMGISELMLTKNPGHWVPRGLRVAAIKSRLNRGGGGVAWLVADDATVTQHEVAGEFEIVAIDVQRAGGVMRLILGYLPPTGPHCKAAFRHGFFSAMRAQLDLARTNSIPCIAGGDWNSPKWNGAPQSLSRFERAPRVGPGADHGFADCVKGVTTVVRGQSSPAVAQTPPSLKRTTDLTARRSGAASSTSSL